jgi:signal transduction histidine kinase
MAVRILLVEDSVTDRELAMRALRRLPEPPGPADILAASDWTEGAALLERGGIDLVLLDYRLPRMNGLEVLHHFGEHPPVPVIMMTGQDDVATAIEMIRAGARDYVPKSTNWDAALRLVVTRVLEQVGVERELAAARAALERHAAELEAEVAARTALLEAQAAEIEKLYLQAEESNRLKNEILSNLSHELLTPLNGILGLSDMLRDDLAEEARPDVVETLNELHGQGLRLFHTIESLLALSRLREGKAGITASRFSLPALLQEWRADALTLLAGSHVAIDWHPASPTEIEHDREKLHAIGYHLLSNAIKFSPGGRVDVRLVATVEGGVLLTVADTGIGIPPAARALLLEDFRQLDGSSTRAHEGLGLGLGIVRRCTALLGGSIAIEDRPGGGTVVTVRVPALAPATARAASDLGEKPDTGPAGS